MKRHTRAHVREQRARWIRKRIGQIRRQWCWWPEQGDVLRDWIRPLGSLSKKDPWDCGRTQCGICRQLRGEHRDLREKAAVKSALEDVDEE